MRCTIIILLSVFPFITAGNTTRTHKVVKGDTLWGLAEIYLGKGNRWPSISYSDGRKPSPRYLQPGQTLVFTSSSDTRVKSSIVNGDQRRSHPPTKPLSFNRKRYGRGTTHIALDGFEFVLLPNQARRDAPPTKSMMNVQISEELINAFFKKNP